MYCSRKCQCSGIASVKGKGAGVSRNKGAKHPYLAEWNRKNPRSGVLSPTWKGDKVLYGGLHQWVSKTLGKPSKCAHCKTVEKRMYHWANVSGKYLRIETDWLRLCVPCHKKYDTEKQNFIR